MRRRAALAAAMLALGLTGCGIPGQTQVRDIGPGPDPGYVTGGAAGAGPPARGDATTKEQFVDNFLAAVAGEPDRVKERVRDYVVEGKRDKIRVGPDEGVNVVRERDSRSFANAGDGNLKVTIKVDQVGVLDGMGSVGPPVLREDTYTFTIGPVGSADSWYVIDPPEVVLLSTTALKQYYTPHTLYFWSRDRRTLVPDRRYMANELDVGQQPTRIRDWLVDGPSDGLDSVVGLNKGTQSGPNIPFPKDRLEVAFNAVAAEQTDSTSGDPVAQLGQQLMWSLYPYMKSELVLRIDGQREQIFTKDSAFYSANARRPPGGPDETEEEPERFALFQHKIYRLKGSPDGGTQPLPQLLRADGVNANIVSAALAREADDKGLHTAAALVTQQEDGRFTLRVGSVVGDATQPFKQSKAHTTMGRAVWLKAPMTEGLVVVDGSLYRFTPDDVALERVANLSADYDGKITDVSAAPDGRRIAIVANKNVYVLGVARDGGIVEVVQAARQVPTPLRNLTAVDWSEETKLVVAGDESGKLAVLEVSIDGVDAEEQQDDVGGPVTHLVAYPDDPEDPDADVSTMLMFSRAGAAFDLSGLDGAIEAGEVMGASGEVDPTQVTAPFFLLD